MEPTGQRSECDDEVSTLRAARAGDRRAFSTLYARYAGRVRAQLTRTAPASQIDDLVQETFLKAYLALPGFRGEGSFAGWLSAIARHVSHGEHRRQGRAPWRLFSTEREAQDAERALTAPSTGDRPALTEALATLSPRLREAVVLSDVEGHTLAEIAARLEEPLPTVAARVRRGRAGLRRVLLLLALACAASVASAYFFGRGPRPLPPLPASEPAEAPRSLHLRKVPRTKPRSARRPGAERAKLVFALEEEAPLGDVIYGQAPRRLPPLFSTAEYRRQGVLVAPGE